VPDTFHWGRRGKMAHVLFRNGTVAAKIRWSDSEHAWCWHSVAGRSDGPIWPRALSSNLPDAKKAVEEQLKFQDGLARLGSR
jgi:hypothetical protein